MFPTHTNSIFAFPFDKLSLLAAATNEPVRQLIRIAIIADP
jgi:hypothetical protein